MARLLFLFACALALLSCNKPNAPDCFQKAGDPATEVRSLSGNIAELILTEHIHLRLANANGAPYIEVTAPENLLPEIRTELDAEGRLTISNDNTCNFMRRYDHLLQVTVYASIGHVVNRGTGDISCLEPLNVLDFLLENRDAAGVVQLDFVHADQIRIQDHTGVAEVSVFGISDTVELFNQGWGKLDASGLHAVTALTNNSSISEMQVRTSAYLYAAVSSSGSTTYYGDPGTIDSDISGQGQLVNGQ